VCIGGEEKEREGEEIVVKREERIRAGQIRNGKYISFYFKGRQDAHRDCGGPITVR
jgi:hypothetical protein